MSHNFSQQMRIYEILKDGEWHSGEELVFTHHLTKFSSRIGEMLRDKKHWPDLKIEFGNEGKWRKYRIIKPQPVQQVLIPLSHFNY